MNRGTGIVLAVVGLIVLLLGVIPTGLFGKLNGIGIGGHNTADVVAVVGLIVLVIGVLGMMRRQSA